MKNNNWVLGSEAESLACSYLEKMDYKIIERNFRCRSGEIDIIARHQDYIVFIEVKYRKDRKCGYPREAVNYYKQKNITRVASYYLLINGAYDQSCRFDVVEITNNDIELIENAFNAVH